MANQVTRPTNRREFMDKLVMPYDTIIGNPNIIFSDPQKLGQPEHNRAFEMSLIGDTDKDYHIGIKDIDEAVKYYFEKVLKLSVVQNNARVNVPISYGNQEDWKAVQQDGFLRDQNGKLLAPLLMFKRTSLTQNRGLGFKLDGNTAHNLQYFETSYNKRNMYTAFNALNGRTPEKKYVVSSTPDYVTIEYSCIVWTYFIEQMDSLIESINFSSRSYWGDPNRFLFYSSIDSFQENLTYALAEDRSVRNEFTITLNGYLIPDTINAKIANANRAFGLSKIIFGLETANSSEQFTANIAQPKVKKIASVIAADSVNITNTINNYGTGLPTDVAAYLTTNSELLGTYVSSTQMLFAKGWATAPTGIPANNINNFSFFINSGYIDPTAIISFVDNGNGTSTLTIDPVILKFSFDSTDTVFASGKFS